MEAGTKPSSMVFFNLGLQNEIADILSHFQSPFPRIISYWALREIELKPAKDAGACSSFLLPILLESYMMELLLPGFDEPPLFITVFL